MTKRRSFSALISCLANRDGAAAVEFAILAPLLALVLAGAVDFGGVVFVKFGLDNAVSSAANFAINGRASVTSTAGGNLASTIGTIVANGSSAVGGTVIVNNGPNVTITGGVVGAASGTASNANNCYCPTLSGTTVTWGTAATCGSACTGGGKAGKFVSIQANRTYTPLFSNYGFMDENQMVSTRAVVQTE